MKCPRCLSPMVEKKGKYGTFYGCSDYPHCRHTQSIEDQTPGAKKLEKQATEFLARRGIGRDGV